MVGVVLPLGGSLAVWAGDELVGRRVGGRVGGGVALEQLQGERLAEVVGAAFALIEGDEILVVGKHEVEGLGGLLEELLAELLAGGTRRPAHRGISVPGVAGGRSLSYPDPGFATTGMHPG